MNSHRDEGALSGPRETVLLTGASGQIGTRLRVELLRLGHRVICLTGSGPVKLDGPDRWIPWAFDSSLTPPALDESIDVLIHLGAQTSAYLARESPTQDLMTNVARFVALLDSLVAAGNAPFVIFAGTATQAGSGAKLLSDSTDLAPETFYDVAKTAGELYLDQFVREGWLSGVTLRFSNIYGDVPALELNRGILAASALKALQGEPLTIFSGYDGARDFLHVSDAVRAILTTMVARHDLTKTAYWVGSGTSHTLSNAFGMIIEAAREIVPSPSQMIFVPAREGLYPIERRSVRVDVSSFRRDSAWEPELSLEEGIRAMVTNLYERLDDRSKAR